MTYSDGTKFVGEWKKGERWEGKQFNKNGKVSNIYFLGRKKKYSDKPRVNKGPAPDWLFNFLIENEIENKIEKLLYSDPVDCSWNSKFNFERGNYGRRCSWLDFTFFEWCFTIILLLPIIYILKHVFKSEFFPIIFIKFLFGKISKYIKPNKDKERS